MKESLFEIKGVHRNWHRGAVAVLCVNHYGLCQGQLHSIFYAFQVIYANIDSNSNFHPSEDIEELERCREQPTLLATPTSCPLIFDSVLCFNSTLGVILYTMVENFSLKVVVNILIFCQFRRRTSIWDLSKVGCQPYWCNDAMFVMYQSLKSTIGYDLEARLAKFFH